MAAAGADPGDLRRLATGGTLVDAAATACTQEPVERAVAPVFALGVVLALRLARAPGGVRVVSHAVERQHGQYRGHTRQHSPDADQRAAT